MKDIAITQLNLNHMPPDEFEEYFFDIIRNLNIFSIIRKRFHGADSTADAAGIRTDTNEKYYLELKRNDLINKDVISHLYSYYQTLKDGRLIIITTGTLSEEAKLLAEQHQILVWDIYTLHNLSQNLVEKKYIDSLFISKSRIHTRVTKESGFIEELNNLNSGHEYWSAFQKLTSDVLEHLFCPPLEPPRYEHIDSDKKNRRDMIFENSGESGFWRSIRETYRAFYIVIDAKNHSNTLKKNPIIEIAHYLKPYGCGMFGIVVSRKGASSTAEHAIKEQWVGNKKMIVSLSDSLDSQKFCFYVP